MRILRHRLQSVNVVTSESLRSISSFGLLLVATLCATTASPLPAQDFMGETQLVLPQQVDSSRVAETTRRRSPASQNLKNEFRVRAKFKKHVQTIESVENRDKSLPHPFRRDEDNAFEPPTQPQQTNSRPALPFFDGAEPSVNKNVPATKTPIENPAEVATEDNSFSPIAATPVTVSPPESLVRENTPVEKVPLEPSIPINTYSLSNKYAGANSTTRIEADSTSNTSPIVKPFLPAAMSHAEVASLPLTYPAFEFDDTDPYARYQDDEDAANDALSLDDVSDEDSSIEKDDEDSADEQIANRDPFDDQEDARAEPSEFMQLWAGRSISDIRIDTREYSNVRPRDRSDELLGAGGGNWQASSTSQKNFSWTAPNIRYQPLYFEDVALERYGQTIGGFWGNAVSYLHFFKSRALLPYSMLVDCPHSCDYPLGYCRPGQPTRRIIQRHWWGWW